jgi:NAD(P)-dependent dehydrogenase (short-subunit alcohol dehydrogenase family)
MDLNGKVAIVTGAGGSGSGRATALRLARDGATVVVSDINEQGGLETVRLITAGGGRATFVRADVGVETDVRDLVAFAEKTYGGLDIMVNNAGSYYPKLLEYWTETMQCNLHGVLYGTLQAVEAMRRRGGGSIVNFGSTSGLGFGPANSPAYDAARAAVMRLTGGLACLREQYGIRVSCLVPHWIGNEEISAYVKSLTPEQRCQRKVPDVLLTPEEIADAVVQLATDERLAGRVMICWGGQPRRLLPYNDPGYAALEDIAKR